MIYISTYSTNVFLVVGVTHIQDFQCIRNNVSANVLNEITSSISRIHRSIPSNDQPLVMSYTSRMPCRINSEYDHVCLYLEKIKIKFTSTHLSPTGVWSEDCAKSALPRCIPVISRPSLKPVQSFVHSLSFFLIYCRHWVTKFLP